MHASISSVSNLPDAKNGVLTGVVHMKLSTLIRYSVDRQS
jgi:hypothetical protein